MKVTCLPGDICFLGIFVHCSLSCCDHPVILLSKFDFSRTLGKKVQKHSSDEKTYKSTEKNVEINIIVMETQLKSILDDTTSLRVDDVQVKVIALVLPGV